MREIIAEFRENKLDEELRGNWVMVLLHRGPSFPLIWIFSRIGVPAMAVSLLAGALALALPLLAWLPPVSAAGWLVFAGGMVFQILDCADGALARLTGTGSRLGAKMDFLIDMAQWGLLYAAIGILADRQFGDWSWTALALAAAWIRLYVRLVRDELQHGSPSEKNRPFQLGEIPVASIAGLSGAIPFLALFGSWLDVAVWMLVAYALLDLADTLFTTLTRASR